MLGMRRNIRIDGKKGLEIVIRNEETGKLRFGQKQVRIFVLGVIISNPYQVEGVYDEPVAKEFLVTMEGQGDDGRSYWVTIINSTPPEISHTGSNETRIYGKPTRSEA